MRAQLKARSLLADDLVTQYSPKLPKARAECQSKRRERLFTSTPLRTLIADAESDVSKGEMATRHSVLQYPGES